MKRYIIKVVSNNKDSIYEDEKAVTAWMFVTAKNKYRAAHKAAIEVEYRQRYNEYGDTNWQVEKVSKNKYIASSLYMPTLCIYFMPVEESVEVVSITEME